MPVDAFCKYHPKQTANWNCPNCKVNFCINCVPESNQDVYPRCTLCRRSLSSLSIAEQIPPFWNNLALFISYPFHRSALIVIFIYALAASLLPDGKIGMIIYVLMLIPLTEFLFELMEQIANGEKVSTDIKQFFTAKNKGLFLKMLFTYGFMVILLGKTIALVGTAIGYLIALFFILGVPASFIILMMEKRVFSMINPVKISYIVKIFGGAYFLLYFIAVVSLIASAQFSAVVDVGSVDARSHNFLAVFLTNVFSIYLVIVLFSMMGYLVFQHHYELNYSVRSANLQSLRQQPTDEMTEVEIFLQEGRFEDAQKLLLKKISDNPMDYKANEKLILLYGIQGNDKHMEKIANPYFLRLIENGKQNHAAEFYFKLSSKGSDFFPESPLSALLLAEKMNNNRQFKVALSLLENYSCEPGGSQFWDKIGLLKARLLAEYCHDNISAINLLDNILKRSVDQELLTEAEKFRGVII